MESHMYQNLRKLINVVDELRDVGLQQYINLPRICVIGTQSSGKSSVLESVVGLDFLPRGEGVVTRRPTELRLVHLSETTNKLDDAWAVFENDKSKRYTDFEAVRKEIERLTDEVAGKNKGIKDDPIILTIYATQCPDLSMIDLPGITRVPLKGSDQTDDIERQTREMALKYVTDPRTIILAVIPANADISTSDSLQIARRVDPKGLRTIGVITKIDLMDRGTDAAKMLLGEEVPLRLGYTGLKNRSQADIKSGKSIKQALADEKEFFSTNAVYRTLPSDVCGINALVNKLTKVLFRQIKNFLPEIKREINNKMRIISDRLSELGEGVPVDVDKRAQLLWTMITDYCEIYKNTIRGKYDKRLQTYFEHQDITGGAQIRSIFNDLLEEFVDKNVTSEMEDYDIDVAIRMHEGDSLPGFPSPDTFEYLILPHLKKIHSPALDCLDRVSQALELLSQKIVNRVFGRFPQLAEQVLEISQDILTREKDITRDILERIVESETGYLFTNDSQYLSDHGSMINNSQNDMHNQGVMISADGKPFQPGSMSNRVDMQQSHMSQEKAQQMIHSVQQSVASLWTTKEKKKTTYSAHFIKEIRQRLDAYFNVVLRNVRDAVPKVIGYFLVRQIQEKLQFELYNDLNNEKKFSDLLGEPAHIMEERKSLTNQLTTLKKASQVLQRDPAIAALNLDEIDDTYDFDLKAMQLGLSSLGLTTPNSCQPSPNMNGIMNPNLQPPHGWKGGVGHSNGLPPSMMNPRGGMGGGSAPNNGMGGGMNMAAMQQQQQMAGGNQKGGMSQQGGSAGGKAIFSDKINPQSSQKHLFEKETPKRQAMANPLFSE